MSSKFFKSTKDDKRLDHKVPNPMFSYNIATDFHQIVSLSSHFFTWYLKTIIWILKHSGENAYLQFYQGCLWEIEEGKNKDRFKKNSPSLALYWNLYLVQSSEQPYDLDSSLRVFDLDLFHCFNLQRNLRNLPKWHGQN